MSFDLYFLALNPEDSYQDAMDRMEEAAAQELPLSEADVERWQSVLLQVRPLLPDAREFIGASHRDLSDDATGMQLSVSPGELTLTIPYWYIGPEAQAMVERLRAVALAVESATGLTAYDPQADSPFIDSGERSAAATFDRVRASFADQRPSTPTPRAGEGKKFGRFFRRTR